MIRAYEIDHCWIVRQIRLEDGSNRQGIARKSCISLSSICAWEHGERVPRISSLLRLAERLDLQLIPFLAARIPVEGLVDDEAITRQPDE